VNARAGEGTGGGATIFFLRSPRGPASALLDATQEKERGGDAEKKGKVKGAAALFLTGAWPRRPPPLCRCGVEGERKG
jgi:hypothetical protein